MKVCLSCGQRFTADDWRCPFCKWAPERLEGFMSFASNLSAINDGFEVEYFEKLFMLENSNFWFRSRNKLLTWALRRYLSQAESFFEIGCGTGYVLSAIQREFPSLRLYGSDIFSSALTFAEQRLNNVSLFQMDARQIPFDSEFDAIGAFDVLEHIDEDRFVLQQMMKALKPGGKIMLTVPQHRFLWSQMDDYACHKRRYTRRELIRKAMEIGFQVIYSTSFVSLLMPLMFLSRMKKRLIPDEFNPRSELEVGFTINSVLENTLTVERLFIKWGFSFPVGGSLLLVANRG